jgi:mannose-6-phosphate isomerase-like protein (cupin superfamily)
MKFGLSTGNRIRYSYFLFIEMDLTNKTDETNSTNSLLFRRFQLYFSMYVKHLKDCPEFVARDNSLLQEILNPLKEDLNIHYSLAWAQVKPGNKTLSHRLKVCEVYYILKGTGIIHINNEEKKVHDNNTIYIPSGATQFIENDGDKNLEFLCIVDPAWTPDAEEILKK